MDYIYENDITKTSANLQKTVAYLVSLHKNEYEWNMLGIKVIGHIDALPIPTGTYNYGDAYMVGTETPYEMYIYTRADSLHTSDYWFNVGKFPQPGEQGPAGPSLIDVDDMYIQGIQNVVYDEDDGAVIDYYNSTLDYIDPNDHNTKQDTIPFVELQLPIKAGKYISMDADEHNMNLEIKVDETDLAADFYKIDKSSVTQITVPVNNKGTVGTLIVSDARTNSSIVQRTSNGSIKTQSIMCNAGIGNYDNSVNIPITNLRVICKDDYVNVNKTTTDTGTLSADALNYIQTYNAFKIGYNNQVYYRMDPRTAPDGTMTFIHIDTTQNGSGGYKATGKAFSITASTRAWQVVDLDFGGGSGSINMYNHHIRLSTSTGDKYFFNVTDTASSYTNTAAIQTKHNDPINVLFAGAGATTTYNPKIIQFTDTGDLQVLTAENVVSETVTASSITVSDQVQLLS